MAGQPAPASAFLVCPAWREDIAMVSAEQPESRGSKTISIMVRGAYFLPKKVPGPSGHGLGFPGPVAVEV